MAPLNPYIAGNPVGGGETFIGRSDILREVVRTLRNPNEDALLLYGQRRIGKTSVLQELRERLPSEGNYAPVYFDLQDQASLPFNLLLAGLSKCINEELGLDWPDLEKSNIETKFKEDFLPKVIEQLPEDSSIVLLFDEFDVLDHPKKEQASAAFFPYLRQLLSSFSQKLQFVFVIGRRPDDLTNITTSLFKSTRSYPVSLLSMDDTASLVRLSENNRSLEWSDAAVIKICELTGGHPFLTQQLCQEIWEQSYSDEYSLIPTVTEDVVSSAVPATLSGARQALEWLWDGLNPAERVIAAALAEAGTKLITQANLEIILQRSGVRILIGELQNAPKVLKEWDLIQESQNGLEFRVELLRQWIADRKPLSREQEEIDKIQPLAENYFQTAYGVYSTGQLDEAVLLLERSISFNPNHFRASQLLGEIFIAQEKVEESLEIFENLYQYQPSIAKPRLVQALLLQAKNSVHEKSFALAIYKRILEMEPRQSEAMLEYQKIVVGRIGEDPTSSNIETAINQFIEGVNLFECAVEEEVGDQLAQNAHTVIDRLLALDKYSLAKSFVLELENSDVNFHLEENAERIDKRLAIEENYKLAVKCFLDNEYEYAAEKFLEIAYIDKDYEDSIYYLLLSSEIEKSFSAVIHKLSLIYEESLATSGVEPRRKKYLLKIQPRNMSEHLDKMDQDLGEVVSSTEKKASELLREVLLFIVLIVGGANFSVFVINRVLKVMLSYLWTSL